VIYYLLGKFSRQEAEFWFYQFILGRIFSVGPSICCIQVEFNFWAEFIPCWTDSSCGKTLFFLQRLLISIEVDFFWAQTKICWWGPSFLLKGRISLVGNHVGLKRSLLSLLAV
jgi:hypothetical protein